MSNFLFIFAWFLCSFFAYGIIFADGQGEFPEYAKENRRSDMVSALTASILFGPFALIGALLFTGGKHGLRFK